MLPSEDSSGGDGASAFDHASYREAEDRMLGLPETVGELIDVQSARRGDARFLVFEDTVITYAELPGIVNRLANGLRARGVGKGDRVAIMSSNRPEFTLLWLALARLGAIEVPINTAYKGRFLAYTLENSAATRLVVEAQFLQAVVDVLPSLPAVSTLAVLSPDHLPALPGIDVCAFDDLAGEDAGAPPVDVVPSDVLAIAYTSGTTGASKGVMLSQGYFCLTGRDQVKYRELLAGDTLYNPMPLFHMNAQTLTVMPALMAGAAVALDRRFSASGFWDRIRAAGATQFNFIGAMISILWRLPERPDDADNPVRVAFGGPIPEEVFCGAGERWGVRLVEGFGSTESGMVAWQPRSAPRAGSLGRVPPEFEVRLVDEHDRPVPAGEPGEIVSRPTRPDSMMSGYYGMPEQTVAAWRNLWFHTGDVARADEDGYLYFLDRRKDALRRRGENISSVELEAALLEFGGLADVAVVAAPSELSEDEVMAYLVAEDEAAFDHAAFGAWCEDNVPRYMIPRYVELIGELPKTPTQRVEKYRLRERGLTRRTWDREAAGFVAGGPDALA